MSQRPDASCRSVLVQLKCRFVSSLRFRWYDWLISSSPTLVWPYSLVLPPTFCQEWPLIWFLRKIWSPTAGLVCYWFLWKDYLWCFSWIDWSQESEKRSQRFGFHQVRSCDIHYMCWVFHNIFRYVKRAIDQVLWRPPKSRNADRLIWIFLALW